MANISSITELKNAIQSLEAEHAYKEKILKDQLLVTFESLKPANLIENTLNDITSSPYLMNNALGSVIGLLSGYISKKITVSDSDSTFRKILGSILQFGVTNLVAQNSDKIKVFSRYLFQNLLKKK